MLTPAAMRQSYDSLVSDVSRQIDAGDETKSPERNLCAHAVAKPCSLDAVMTQAAAPSRPASPFGSRPSRADECAPLLARVPGSTQFATGPQPVASRRGLQALRHPRLALASSARLRGSGAAAETDAAPSRSGVRGALQRFGQLIERAHDAVEYRSLHAGVRPVHSFARQPASATRATAPAPAPVRPHPDPDSFTALTAFYAGPHPDMVFADSMIQDLVRRDQLVKNEIKKLPPCREGQKRFEALRHEGSKLIHETNHRARYLYEVRDKPSLRLDDEHQYPLFAEHVYAAFLVHSAHSDTHFGSLVPAILADWVSQQDAKPPAPASPPAVALS